jgi:hypothetical protein
MPKAKKAKPQQKFEDAQVDVLASSLGLPQGGIVEVSTWGGDGGSWSRQELRFTKSVKPLTIEGQWYAVGVVRALAEGLVITDQNREAIRAAAQTLAIEIDKCLELYDS